MTQPKVPPLSVRLSPNLLAEVEAYATDHGLTRNAGVVALIQAGLSGVTLPANPEITAPLPSVAAVRRQARGHREPGPGAALVHLGPVERKPGSLLKKGKA